MPYSNIQKVLVISSFDEDIIRMRDYVGSGFPGACTPLQLLFTIDFPFDVAFSAWMPSEVNCTPDILKYRPKLIVYVHTDHFDESSGRKQTGTTAAYTELPQHYQLIGEWSITRPKDFLNEIWVELTPNIEEVRTVKIFADEPYHGINVGENLEQAEPYGWEIELDMVLTALKAKLHLKERGFPV